MTEMPGEMVECVARALELSIENSGHNFSEAGAKAVYRDAAVVAMAAMREPSAAMLRIGNIMCGDEFGRQAEDVWQAMIDAALGEEGR